MSQRRGTVPPRATRSPRTEIARGIYLILKTIYSGGSLGAVVSAITGSLTWWTALLYGITGLGTIVATFATDGAALVAEIVIVMASAGFLLSDVVKAAEKCNLFNKPAPPLHFQPVTAFKTLSGNFLTIVNNGGLANDAVAIQTDRRAVSTWEKFKIEVVDAKRRTFALRTSNGRYVTAVNGGGMGGPNDASSPIHTDATVLGPWEKLIVEPQDDGTYAIRTTEGYYLTATNGGGVGEAANRQPIHTDATHRRGWEIFTAVGVPA